MITRGLAQWRFVGSLRGASRFIHVYPQLLNGSPQIFSSTVEGVERVAKPRKVSLRLLGFTSLLASVLLTPAVFSASALAGSCPNEQIRSQGYARRLPDCRAYEQVTPVDKGGTNPTGAPDSVQASRVGDAITFVVPSNMPGGEGAATTPLFLANRKSEGWSSRGLLLPVELGRRSSWVFGWSEDLSQVALADEKEEGAATANLYLRHIMSDSRSIAGEVEAGSGRPVVAGFSEDGSDMIFESSVQLLPNAAPGKTNLYEWNAATERLSLAGVLPGPGEVAPPGGSFAGPYAWLTGNRSEGGAMAIYYTQNTISRDGARVFFGASETGQLYLREHGESTIAVPGGHFDAATPDGAKVVVDDGSTLSEYDVVRKVATPITPANSEVQGTLGMSEDGSYVYFAANAMLPGSGATSVGDCEGLNNENGHCNLYLWHSGKVDFVALLSNGAGDARDWIPTPTPNPNGGGTEEKASRVTPDGKTVLFRSTQQLTSYDNTPSDFACGNREGAPAPCAELYRYDAESGRLTCISCDPTGAAPVGEADLQSIVPSFTGQRQYATPFLTRNLSASGHQIFFETSDALVPGDTNGQLDVYEWESEGVGACQRSSESFNESSGGCLYLISTGRSFAPSYFADASANGESVFFFTDQPLVGQDEDQLVDIYDARVNGGIAAQSLSPPAPCGGESCHGTLGSPPLFAAPSSTTFSGAGNLTPPVSRPVVTSRPRPLTRAQKLTKALATCRKQPKRSRDACIRRARKRYRGKSKTTTNNGRSK